MGDDKVHLLLSKYSSVRRFWVRLEVLKIVESTSLAFFPAKVARYYFLQLSLHQESCLPDGFVSNDMSHPF